MALYWNKWCIFYGNCSNICRNKLLKLQINLDIFAPNFAAQYLHQTASQSEKEEKNDRLEKKSLATLFIIAVKIR